MECDGLIDSVVNCHNYCDSAECWLGGQVRVFGIICRILLLVVKVDDSVYI